MNRDSSVTRVPVTEPPRNVGRIQADATDPICWQASSLDRLVQGFWRYTEYAAQFVYGDLLVHFSIFSTMLIRADTRRLTCYPDIGDLEIRLRYLWAYPIL